MPVFHFEKNKKEMDELITGNISSLLVLCLFKGVSCTENGVRKTREFSDHFNKICEYYPWIRETNKKLFDFENALAFMGGMMLAKILQNDDVIKFPIFLDDDFIDEGIEQFNYRLEQEIKDTKERN